MPPPPPPLGLLACSYSNEGINGQNGQQDAAAAHEGGWSGGSAARPSGATNDEQLGRGEGAEWEGGENGRGCGRNRLSGSSARRDVCSLARERVRRPAEKRRAAAAEEEEEERETIGGGDTPLDHRARSRVCVCSGCVHANNKATSRRFVFAARNFRTLTLGKQQKQKPRQKRLLIVLHANSQPLRRPSATEANLRARLIVSIPMATSNKSGRCKFAPPHHRRAAAAAMIGLPRESCAAEGERQQRWLPRAAR